MTRVTAESEKLPQDHGDT